MKLFEKGQKCSIKMIQPIFLIALKLRKHSVLEQRRIVEEFINCTITEIEIKIRSFRERTRS